MTLEILLARGDMHRFFHYPLILPGGVDRDNGEVGISEKKMVSRVFKNTRDIDFLGVFFYHLLEADLNGLYCRRFV